jgi:hypothetical protein
VQRWSIVTSIIVLSLVIAVILPGCNLLKKSASTSSDSSSAQSDPSQPLTSSWSMTRTGYQPPFPPAVPGFLVDQIFPKNPVWSITVSGSQLAVTYDGKTTWFNPMGMNVKTNPVTATQNADKKSCTFKGGGNLSAAKLPGALSLLGALTGGMEDINVNYTDTIVVTLTSPTQITATITYSSSGTYTGGKGKDNFNYPGSLTYTGTKK